MNIRGLVIGALVLAGCSETASGPAPIPAPSTGWTYGVYVDEMDGSSHPWACVESENVVQASFPHKSARPTLCIQKHNDQSDGVYISMNKSGQVQCHDCFVRVRSDDKEPHEAPADQSSNGETDMLYFGLGDVMAVKNCRVEAVSR